MLLYAIGAFTVVRSSYYGWEYYNKVKHMPDNAPYALRYGAFGALAPIIYFTPLLVTSSIVSSIGDKVFKEYKHQEPLERFLADSFGETMGLLSGLIVTDLLGQPWIEVSKVAAIYLAESLP